MIAGLAVRGGNSGGNRRPLRRRPARPPPPEAIARAGENQERVARGEKLVFFCECGRRGCTARVRLTGPQYEVVRADARRFVIAPGHEFLAPEDVVEERAGYVVVQKHEDVRALVERMDLRRGDAGHDS